MSRWNFILFGGDARSPLVKRMTWRLGLAGFVTGFAFGVRSSASGDDPNQVFDFILASLSLVSLVVIWLEARHFYSASDELTRHVFMQSLAIGGGVTFTGLALYAIGQIAFAWSNPSMMTVTGVALLIMACAWIYAAWKAT